MKPSAFRFENLARFVSARLQSFMSQSPVMRDAAGRSVQLRPRRAGAAHPGGRDERRCGVPGPERAVIYRLAAETGLRAGEIRSLTRASFELDGDEPTVTVGAAYAKNRRQDTLPLRKQTAALLKPHLANKAPAAPAFRMPRR